MGIVIIVSQIGSHTMFAVRSQQPWGVPTSPYGFDEPRELPQRLSYAGLEAAALLCSLHNADMSYQPEMQPRADTDGGNLVEPEASRTKASETLKQQEKGPSTTATDQPACPESEDAVKHQHRGLHAGWKLLMRGCVEPLISGWEAINALPCWAQKCHTQTRQWNNKNRG